ncbi:36520_t:CDS:1, partial [Gigaspora margarita]
VMESITRSDYNLVKLSIDLGHLIANSSIAKSKKNNCTKTFDAKKEDWN